MSNLEKNNIRWDNFTQANKTKCVKVDKLS